MTANTATQGVLTSLQEKLIGSDSNPALIQTIDRASFEYLLTLKDREIVEEYHPIIDAERTRREKIMQRRQQSTKPSSNFLVQGSVAVGTILVFREYATDPNSYVHGKAITALLILTILAMCCTAFELLWNCAGYPVETLLNQFQFWKRRHQSSNWILTYLARLMEPEVTVDLPIEMMEELTVQTVPQPFIRKRKFRQGDRQAVQKDKTAEQDQDSQDQLKME